MLHNTETGATKSIMCTVPPSVDKAPEIHLSCHEFLQIAHCVVLVALDPDLLAQTVVENDLNHFGCGWRSPLGALINLQTL